MKKKEMLLLIEQMKKKIEGLESNIDSMRLQISILQTSNVPVPLDNPWNRDPYNPMNPYFNPYKVTFDHLVRFDELPTYNSGTNPLSNFYSTNVVDTKSLPKGSVFSYCVVQKDIETGA